MKNSNPCTSIFIEFHILQSFPVTCLNRDDVGAPKSAIVGGVPRARVSSQCWKRQVRLSLHDLGVNLGIRTKQLGVLISQACERLGAESEKANRLPHVRGGVSRGQSSRFFPGWSSPRAWGCFRFLRARYRRDRVFPTCVGVFPLSHWRPLCHSCLPHVRGGVSARVSAGRRKTSSSPRAWGCFFSLTDTRLLYRVFPTCVGVFLIRS